MQEPEIIGEIPPSDISVVNGKSGLISLPLEIQTSILRFFYTPGGRFKKSTSILTTCKALYELAYPIFLQNYMFNCIPIRPGVYGEDLKVEGDIIRIVWPHDDERWQFHLFDDEWMAGLKSGMASLFAEETSQLSHKDSQCTEDDDDTESESGSESEFDVADAVWADILSFEERAQEVAKRWIRRNKFASFLKHLGPEQSKTIQHIRILWGDPETIRSGESIEVGPYAIGIMSIVFGKYLPNLTEVALQLKHSPEGYSAASFSQFCWTCALEIENKQDFQEYAYAENERPEVMDIRNFSESAREFEFVQALKLLLQNCSSLSMLRLENWHGHSSRLVWPEWWWDLVKRDSLTMSLEFPFSMPWRDNQVMVFSQEQQG